MRKITLKYRGRCVKCNRWIPAGEIAFWEKDKGVWHLDCDKTNIQKPSQVRKRRSHPRLVVFLVSMLVIAALLLVEYAVSTSVCPHGGMYYLSICNRLCGCQYNVCVSLDYNCANDYQAIPGFPLESTIVGLLLGIALVLFAPRRSNAMAVVLSFFGTK